MALRRAATHAARAAARRRTKQERRGRGAFPRPDARDVERIARGEAALRRGVGSREVPHRLNADELARFRVAKERGYGVTGSSLAFRRERRGSPLFNILRQWADAHAVPAVVVIQGTGTDGEPDAVVVDTSPLRTADDAPERDAAVRVALEAGACLASDDVAARADRDDAARATSDAAAAEAAGEIPRLEAAVAERADAVRALKEQAGGGAAANKDPAVVAAVAELLEAKAALADAEATAGGDSAGATHLRELADQEDLEERARESSAIWELPPRLLRFECADRKAARDLAASMVKELCSM